MTSRMMTLRTTATTARMTGKDDDDSKDDDSKGNGDNGKDDNNDGGNDDRGGRYGASQCGPLNNALNPTLGLKTHSSHLFLGT